MRAYGNSFNWCSDNLPTDCQATIDDYYYNAMKYLCGLIGYSLFTIPPYFFQVYTMTKIED
jgi:hypothetical protein